MLEDIRCAPKECAIRDARYIMIHSWQLGIVPRCQEFGFEMTSLTIHRKLDVGNAACDWRMLLGDVEDVTCPVDDMMINKGHRLIRIFRSEGGKRVGKGKG
jgi:hypothetical protein